MFLLVTGASGAGKSTVRRLVAPVLPRDIVCVELHDVVSVPAFSDIAWRQQATELVVRRALALQAQGQHLLLSGDPVAAGEVLASPSALDLDGIAACLLDLSPDAQSARLTQRGDDPALLAQHHAFAEWMRGHARDPQHLPHVLSTNGWQAMCWERLAGVASRAENWAMDVLDTSRLTPDEVAGQIVVWCRRVLSGSAPLLWAHRTEAR